MAHNDDEAERIRRDDQAWELRCRERMQAMMNGDDRAERRRERERLIPSEVQRAAAHDVYLHAAAHRYVEGDGEAWAACFDALRVECARLAAECERMGLAAMALDVGAWPEGGATIALTDTQATALLHAADARRVLFDAACSLVERFGPVVVRRP
jgi:hypothetical protein